MCTKYLTLLVTLFVFTSCELIAGPLEINYGNSDNLNKFITPDNIPSSAVKYKLIKRAISYNPYHVKVQVRSPQRYQYLNEKLSNEISDETLYYNEGELFGLECIQNFMYPNKALSWHLIYPFNLLRSFRRPGPRGYRFLLQFTLQRFDDGLAVFCSDGSQQKFTKITFKLNQTPKDVQEFNKIYFNDNNTMIYTCPYGQNLIKRNADGHFQINDINFTELIHKDDSGSIFYCISFTRTSQIYQRLDVVTRATHNAAMYIYEGTTTANQDVDLLKPLPPNITQTLTTSTTLSPSTTTTLSPSTTTKLSPTATTTLKTNVETTKENLVQLRCINFCDNSNEWRPVCGTNDITYKNSQHLLCAQYCGVDVQLKHLSSCANNNENNNETPANSTISVPYQDTMHLPPLLESCIKQCDLRIEDKPVCGTNDVTYKNPSYLQCAKNCGVNVETKHNSPCSQENYTGQGVETSNTGKQQSITAPNKSDQEICIDACVKTLTIEDSKYVPVCGSNNVTYRNIGHLQCAKTCNADVVLVAFLPCTESNVVPTTSTNAPEITDPAIKNLYFGEGVIELRSSF